MAPLLAPAAGAASSVASGKALANCMSVRVGGKLVASGEQFGRCREVEIVCSRQEPLERDGQIERDAVAAKLRSEHEAGVLNGRGDMLTEERGRIEVMRVEQSRHERARGKLV
jgi:hypothetical protein